MTRKAQNLLPRRGLPQTHAAIGRCRAEPFVVRRKGYAPDYSLIESAVHQYVGRCSLGLIDSYETLRFGTGCGVTQLNLAGL